MATFEITEGAPGQGKSLYTADLAERLILRNIKWEKTGNKRRLILSNMKFSPQFEEKYHGYFEYWTDSNKLVTLTDCDIIWDEIATELDSRNWPNLSVEMKRFLSQYRKRGVDIYANTQDFSMIDQRARLMITHVRTLKKFLGSRDISTTKPPPKKIWGIIIVRDVENYRETNPEKKKYGFLPSFMFITRHIIEIYDTRQDIKAGEAPKLKHEVRYCEFYGVSGHPCEFHHKIIHS